MAEPIGCVQKTTQKGIKLLEDLISMMGGNKGKTDGVEPIVADVMIAMMVLCDMFDKEKIIDIIEEKLSKDDIYTSASNNSILKLIVSQGVGMHGNSEMFKDLVFSYVCNINNITVRNLLANNKTQQEEYVFARQLIMYAFREFEPIKRKVSEIGGWFEKDHATVSHAVKHIKELKDSINTPEDISKIRRVENYITGVLLQ